LYDEVDRPVMNLVLDADVRAVAEFMQCNIVAMRLVPVVKALSEIAPILWGHYQPEEKPVLRLAHVPIKVGVAHTQSSANE
jgi:hypothetical protein